MRKYHMLRLLSLVVAGLGATALTLSCTDEPTSGSMPAGGTGMQSAPAAAFTPTLTTQTSGTTQRFFAVSPVNDRVVWASAAGGTFAKTTDGGATWVSRLANVPGAATLQFRDVHAVSERIAYLLSAGEGLANRIYKTEDGGETWELQFQAGADPRFFYDCFDFWTPNRGITFADGIDGRFPVVRTSDGGETWRDIANRLPGPQAGEAGFAASGTCITTQSGNRAWIGTGGGVEARVLATTDGGDSWSSYKVPILQGTSVSGVVSIDFRDPFRGILGGGDILANTPQDNVARSSDGGKTWTLTTPTPFLGAVYGLSYVPGMRLAVVATGPNGAAWSPDEGDTWSLLPGISNFWAVAFASRSAGWLVGGDGQIVKVDFSREAAPENRSR
jgi:photosystem II stability/assembly factor-like uncharacterized protein